MAAHIPCEAALKSPALLATKLTLDICCCGAKLKCKSYDSQLYVTNLCQILLPWQVKHLAFKIKLENIQHTSTHCSLWVNIHQ